MVAAGRTALIGQINRTLASHGKAIVKTPKNGRPKTAQEYYLLDSREGTKRYLSLKEVRDIARELGVLAIGSGL
jgi:hypothetical protein